MLLALRCGAAGRSGEVPSPVTFNEHVAPIVHANCTPCHRPGHLAPFPLVSYEDVRQRAGLVARVTGTRYMPPWLPDSAPGEFVGQRTLSAGEIDLFARWAAGGALEGDPDNRPEPPEFISGWQLGQPDLVVDMDVPFLLPGSGPDIFRNFVIPLPVETARYVKGIELRPGNGHVLHHATLTVDRSRVSRRMDEQGPGVGFDGMRVGGSRPPDGHFLGWTPGKVPSFLPEGMGWRLEPGSDLVIQMHLMPSGKPQAVTASVGLYFTDTPPRRIPQMLRLGSQVIDMPAGESRYRITDSFELPVDVTVLRVYPHAHYLATKMRGTAVLPNGEIRRLVEIAHWDFNWQDEYRYSVPIALPAGTRLEMEYEYDNSSGNPRNPNTPPQRIVYGPRSSDEMGDLWIQVLPRQESDLSALRQAYARKEVRALIGGYEMRLGIESGDWLGHASVAALYLRLGENDAARRHLLESLRLSPDYDEAHNTLGSLHEREGRMVDAIRHYELAIASEADNHKAHYNLANVFVHSNRLDDALRHYHRAIAINPDYVAAHRNLAYVLSLAGDEEAASDHRQIAEDLQRE